MTEPALLGYLRRVELTTRQFDRLYRSFRQSDARLDDRVLVAVRTTGVYCLPSCRARKPKPENVRFYFSRVQAEREGFRACRRCRPDVAGGSRALEQAALNRWLEELAASDDRIERLARANGRSPSGLYRMFRRNLGHGPRQARTEARLRVACELLAGGKTIPGWPAGENYSVTQVAYEAGFGSLATFYRWFRRALGITPTEFQRRAAVVCQRKLAPRLRAPLALRRRA